MEARTQETRSIRYIAMIGLEILAEMICSFTASRLHGFMVSRSLRIQESMNFSISGCTVGEHLRIPRLKFHLNLNKPELELQYIYLNHNLNFDLKSTLTYIST